MPCSLVLESHSTRNLPRSTSSADGADDDDEAGGGSVASDGRRARGLLPPPLAFELAAGCCVAVDGLARFAVVLLRRGLPLGLLLALAAAADSSLLRGCGVRPAELDGDPAAPPRPTPGLGPLRVTVGLRMVGLGLGLSAGLALPPPLLGLLRRPTGEPRSPEARTESSALFRGLEPGAVFSDEEDDEDVCSRDILTF